MSRAESPGGPRSSPGSPVSGSVGGPNATVWTVVVGGGSGRRFGRPKQYEPLDARRVIDVSREVAESCTDGVIVVVPAEDATREGGVAGGSTRSTSVRAGLAAVPADVDVICVHDAARPLASRSIYQRVVDAVVAGADAAIPAVPVTDTIKMLERSVPPLDEDVLGVVASTPERSRLVAVQTPQAFRAERLRAAHEGGTDATDDAALVEAAGGRVVVVRGEVTNLKITEPDDLEQARRHLADRDAGSAG